MQKNGVRKTIVEAMSDDLFLRFSQFIQVELGIKMPPAKKTMLQARLQKRLWKLGFDSFNAYYDYVFSAEGREFELPHMVDVVTTNKTVYVAPYQSGSRKRFATQNGNFENCGNGWRTTRPV